MCLFKCSPRLKHLPQSCTLHTYTLPFFPSTVSPSAGPSPAVGTRRPRLFFVRFGTGTGGAVRIRGPRRSEVKELEEASKNVYSPAGGEVGGTAGGDSTRGCSSGSSTRVMEEEAGTKGGGSVLGIFAGWGEGWWSMSSSVSSSTARASKARLRDAGPFCDRRSSSESSSLPYLPQRTVGRPVVCDRVIRFWPGAASASSTWVGFQKMDVRRGLEKGRNRADRLRVMIEVQESWFCVKEALRVAV